MDYHGLPGGLYINNTVKYQMMCGVAKFEGLGIKDASLLLLLLS
jgi:hypothetical protein